MRYHSKIIGFGLLCVFAFNSVNIVVAQSESVLAATVVEVPSNIVAPRIEATAWVLMEMNSGWIVSSHKPNQPLPPASITKLMSNYVVYQKLAEQQIGLQDQVSISEQAWRAEGSRMFANVDSKIELQHLLKSTVIQSGNDAAIALAEHVGGTETFFASLMNTAAKNIGLRNSFFINSTGLPADEHRMSASDIALLSAALIRDFPEYYAWYAEKSYTHNKITQANRNKLLWKDSTVDGLKTGHTEAAGYCLVGSALRNGERWIAVVLGAQDAQSREEQVLSLLNYGFAAYQPIPVLQQQGGVVSADVYFGEVDKIHLQAPSQVNIVVPRGREQDVAIDFLISPYYKAPISVGQSLGIASLSLDGKLLMDVPLVATSSISEGGLWSRLTDSVGLWLRNF